MVLDDASTKGEKVPHSYSIEFRIAGKHIVPLEVTRDLRRCRVADMLAFDSTLVGLFATPSVERRAISCKEI